MNAPPSPPDLPTRSRTIEWSPPVLDLAEFRNLSGLEYLRHALQAGQRPPPIGVLMNFSAARFEEGLAVFEGTPDEFHYNPLGTVHGGFAATMLDSALGCSVHSTLKAGFGYTTVELKINYVRAMTAKTGRVICEGRIISVGSRIATAEARLTGADGKLYAHGTTTCLIFPLNEAA
ncbi:MAG TPA: PaaI family thioesterase [Candidatus Cybelea sp.]|nr:PaaI family thioesterase [Candidatus Cybelea sp.]